MKNIVKDKRIFIVYVFVVILLGLGISYALSNANLSLSLTSAIVRIDEKAYGDTEFDSSSLEMVPILDSEVESKKDNIIKIDFTVGGASSNNNNNIIYDVVLKDLNVNCELLSPYLKWKLVKNGTSIADGSLDYKFDTIDSNGRFLLTTIQQDLPDYDVNQVGYDNYSFYMWISDSCQSDDVSACTNAVDQSDLMGKNLGGKIEVELYTEGKKELLRHPSTNLSGSACGERYLVKYNLNGGKLATTDNKYVVPGEKYGELPVPSKISTVSFDTSGGSNIKNLSNKSNTKKKIEQTIKSRKAKVKFLADEINKKTVNHVFDGWYLEKDFHTKINNDTVVETDKTVDLYAKWFNSQITLPITSKTGYDFLGWYSDYKLLNLVGKAEDSYEVINDITLYAKWQGKKYVLTYDSNGGSICSPNTKTVIYGEKYGELCVPTKEDYTFAGWYTSLEGGVLVDENTVTEGDATVYARWVVNTYTVTLNNQGATSPGTSMIYESYDTKFSLSLDGDAMTSSSNPITKPSKNYTVTFNYNGNGENNSSSTAAYVFGGYYTEVDGKGTKYIDSNGYLTSSASPKTFKSNGSLYAQWVSTSISLPSPTRNGYTFDGWYTDSNAGTKIGNGGESYTPTTSLMLYAHWSPKKYTLTYNSNGGTSCTPATKTITYGEKYGELCVPTKTDYIFSGWYTSLNGGTLVDENTIATGNVTIYAHWVFRTYKVTLDNQGATSSGTTAIYEMYSTKFSLSIDGNPMTSSANAIVKPSRSYAITYNYNGNGQSNTSATANYTFGGYYTSTNGNGTQYINANGYLTSNASNTYFNSDGMLYAKWTSTSVTLPTPSRNGYTFNGWYTLSNGGTKVGGGGAEYTPEGNITLYAQWSPKTYTVALDNQGATSVGTTSIYETYGNKFSLTSDGNAMATSANPITIPSKVYTITYNYNGNGQSDSSVTANYVFGGYYTASGGSGTQYIASNGYLTSNASNTYFSANGILYAKWINANVVLPSPTKSGFVFGGWYTSASGGSYIGDSGDTYNPTSNITLYAHWISNAYKVTLDNQGATSSGTTSIYETYGSKFSLTSGGNAMTTSSNPITRPTRSYTVTYNYNGSGQSNTSATANYTFGGYYTGTSGSGTQYINANGYLTTSASNTYFGANGTLYAKWTSSSIILPTPTRTGYTFNGWYTASSGGTKVGAGGAKYTPNKNLTLYAQWTITKWAISSPATGANTFATAVSKANAGATLTLQSSYTDSTGVSISKNLTVNFANYTVTMDNNGTGVSVASPAAVTFNSIVNGSSSSGGISKTVTGYTINVSKGGKLTIKQGTYKNSVSYQTIRSFGYVGISGGTIQSNGGPVIQNGSNGSGENIGKMLISGGTIKGTGSSSAVIRNFSDEKFTSSECTELCSIHINGATIITATSTMAGVYSDTASGTGKIHFPASYTGTVTVNGNYAIKAGSGKVAANGGTFVASSKSYFKDGTRATFGRGAKCKTGSTTKACNSW